jgi:hypothetical protein
MEVVVPLPGVEHRYLVWSDRCPSHIHTQLRDGKLILHTENEDYSFLKHELDETEQETTHDEVANRYPELLADEVLAGRRTETRLLLR